MKHLNEFINESLIEDLPKIESLEDGIYTGLLSGNCFTFEGNKYYSPVGILAVAPGAEYSFEIKEGKVIKHGDKENMVDYKYEESE